ncbi:Amuc_1098 family type IV pilus outer membrane protein [Verrucomicrobium sp. BvORR106]|uniref:Amuc_1098 family type IV pilus outer membrane protein n=1 Tax=Verrucomicrobium sp. BvORR106 TaxID=1403819 RepID=UPI0009DFFC86|nr:Amuc_1098 family type IV pilus outer membrane protein [Verrucomicrobium sp. BvORR106]
MNPALIFCHTSVLCCCALAPAMAGSPNAAGGVSSLAERELARRMQRETEARECLTRGDALMKDADCEAAAREYQAAIDLLPDAPRTQALREEAMARYGDAAVCLARERAKNGRYAEARALLEGVLKLSAPSESARKLLADLDDPARYEPALTPEHVKNVAQVETTLQMGYSYYNIGDYDAAIRTFQEALRIDKYNAAARRGMERAEQKRAEYYDTARDHQRAKMLNAVNAGWEDQVPAAVTSTVTDAYTGGPDASRYYTEKMQRIIFPAVQFQGASIDEAIEFMRIKSRDYDTVERDPSRRGVNLILKAGASPSTSQISLDLKDVPMVEALRYITELAGMKYKIEPYAVVVVPLSDVGTEQYTRTFKVPPSFLSLGQDSSAAAPAAADPFASGGTSAAAATLKPKATALEILRNNGINFPEGSSATFVAATSQLIVRNTQPNLDQVEAFVEGLTKAVPQQIYITTKFVEVSQKNTDELGFDWLLGQFDIGGRTFASGGTAATSSNYSFTQDGTAIGGYSVTSGNRSGSSAIAADSIDGLISGQSQASSVAPGIFTLAGVFTDPQFQVTIRALSQKKGVDLMSAPSVTTRSGQRATVEVIREFIYPTEFDPPQIPQNFGATSTSSTTGTSSTSSFPVTPTTPTAFEMRPVGVRLEVDPVIGPDGYTIDLNLAPEVTEFEGFINYGSPINTASTDALGNPTTVTLTENKIEQPVFSTRKVTTAVTVWDGQTVAMGGLIREDVQDVEDKVPILGDLPFLGRLFQSKAEDHFKRNLMIFVTAKLIDPSGEPVRKPAPAPTAPVSGGASTPPVSLDGGPGLLPAVNP